MRRRVRRTASPERSHLPALNEEKNFIGSRYDAGLTSDLATFKIFLKKCTFPAKKIPGNPGAPNATFWPFGPRFAESRLGKDPIFPESLGSSKQWPSWCLLDHLSHFSLRRVRTFCTPSTTGQTCPKNDHFRHVFKKPRLLKLHTKT